MSPRTLTVPFGNPASRHNCESCGHRGLNLSARVAALPDLGHGSLEFFRRFSRLNGTQLRKLCLKHGQRPAFEPVRAAIEHGLQRLTLCAREGYGAETMLLECLVS